MERCGGGFKIPITPIECIFKYIWYHQNNIYREAYASPTCQELAKVVQHDVALISNNKIVGTSVMEIIGGFFMPSITMEDTMKKKQIDLVQFTPDMNEEQILEKLEKHLLKQGWTIIEDEALEEKDNG